MEAEKTNWFHKSGIYELNGPKEAIPGGGPNEGKYFIVTKMAAQNDGTITEESDIGYCAHSKNHTLALKSAVRYFTGPDYELDLQEFTSCSVVEGEENAS